MLLRGFSAAALSAAMLLTQACGSSRGNPAPATQAAAHVPEMTIQLYDGIGGGVRMATNEPTNDCEERSPNLGKPNGNPNDDPAEDQICTLPPRPISDALNPDCPCEGLCLEPYFDHNKQRTPTGTIQMYTPPASRRYFSGVPSAKHWENGVTQNIFTFDIELTSAYEQDLENVYVVLVGISPDGTEVGGLREGFQDARPHTCLNNDYAVWSFGDLAVGDTVTRSVKLKLPNDDPFTITGFIVSLDGEDCEPGLQDADGDNLSDADEATLGTDPQKADTDGDGLFDGAEDNGGVFISYWQTGTDPLLRDSDGDCFGDGTEIIENFDPLDANSHPDRKCSKADLINPVP